MQLQRDTAPLFTRVLVQVLRALRDDLRRLRLIQVQRSLAGIASEFLNRRR